MICKNCGFQTESKFCPNCGSKIQEEIAPNENNECVVPLNETTQMQAEEINATNTQMVITEKAEDNSQKESASNVEENSPKGNEVASTIVASEQNAITIKAKDSKTKFSPKKFIAKFYTKSNHNYFAIILALLMVASFDLLGRQIYSILLGTTIPLRFIYIGTPILIVGVVLSVVAHRLKYEVPRKDKMHAEDATQLNVKKFRNTCNYLVWGICLLSYICLILGATTFLKSTEYVDTSYMSIMAIPNKILPIIVIVISSIMILMQSALMIYEFVFLKTSDLDLTEEGKAQVDAICTKNKSSKIKLIASCLMIAVLIISMAPVISWSGNKFAQFTNLEVGYSKEKIISLLGQADTSEKEYWEYYGDNYKKVVDELEKLTKESGLSTIASSEEDDLEDIFGELDKELGEADKILKKIEKLEEKLQTMEYKYIRINFDEKGLMVSAQYESKKCEQSENKIKTVKSIQIKGNTTPQQYEKINVTYKIKYNDNSLYIGGITNTLAESLGQYPFELPIINVVKLTNLTKDIVENMLEEYKDSEIDEIHYNVPTSVISIDNNAFKRNNDGSNNVGNVYNKLKSISLSKNVKTLGKDLFASCENLKEINFSGTKAEWNAIKKASNWNSGKSIVIHCNDGDIN